MTKIATLAVLVGGLVAAITGGRVWVRFTVDDPVLGPSARAASGYAVSSALSAACIVALAAGLAALLTRRMPRSIALMVLALDAAWGCWLTVRLLADPAQALITSGSPELGPTVTGNLSVQGAQPSVYPYVFLVATVIVACAAMVVAVGTSTRFAPRKSVVSSSASDAARSGAIAVQPLPAAERERRANAAAWDDISRGDEPTTLDPEDTSTGTAQSSESPDSLA